MSSIIFVNFIPEYCLQGGEVVNEDGRQMADVYVEGRTIKYHHHHKKIIPTKSEVTIFIKGCWAEPGSEGGGSGDRRHGEAGHTWWHRHTHTLSDALHGDGESSSSSSSTK